MTKLGREVMQPVDLLLGTAESNIEIHQPHQYTKKNQKALEKAHKTARDNLKAAQFRQKRDYDVNLNNRIYNKGEVVYSLRIGQMGEENIHDLSQLFEEDNDREPDIFVQETENGINKDHAGSTGLGSFQQLQYLESFLDITEEIQEIGIEQHGSGLESRILI
ncbi:unnamed protein product [Mytilus edulis]|uniref:Uncharacterized protein n=1 Tax=Mytilus edulis TaxID=6550 RepID=A0A8S3SKT6_MYTED|nr:unnamed protein product [Mytilus edulis]